MFGNDDNRAFLPLNDCVDPHLLLFILTRVITAAVLQYL
jgi:hypothetical protein